MVVIGSLRGRYVGHSYAGVMVVIGSLCTYNSYQYAMFVGHIRALFA